MEQTNKEKKSTVVVNITTLNRLKALRSVEGEVLDSVVARLIKYYEENYNGKKC